MEITKREQTFATGQYGSGYIPTTTTYVFSDGTEVSHSHYEDHWAGRSAGRSGTIFVYGEREISTEGLEHTIIGDDPEMDKRWKAHNREVIKAKRDVLAHVLNHPEFTQLPDDLQKALSSKMGFSRYAGCSCPCSPGFKLKGAENTRLLGIKGTVSIEAAK